MSTMLEAFDTQMVDFQTDPDYSMQLSSSDPWFQEEATMEDDGHISLQTTIEVDMEPYDEHQQPEYEMEDDLGIAETAPTDIHDVEVYDASRFQSPDIPHDESPIAPVDSREPPPIALQYTESSKHVLSSSETTQKLDDSTSDVQYHRSPSPHPPEASISLTTEEPIPAEEILQSEDHSHGAGLTVATDGHDSSSVVAEEPQTQRQPEAEDPEESNSEENSEILEAHTEPPDDSGNGGNQHVEEYTGSPEFEESTSDPHEISEGVYIDPPPPVLISLSADEPSISLFNLPSKPHLDSRSQNESGASELVVLLAQLPTLYYEPLSSVFEALRQEEYLSAVPGLLSGELLLDAYDLELIMSEDYTYAHELSLHDLNVLHDGLNNTGPLRLRLRTVTPRFIDRYHFLQNQIAQIQLVEPTSEQEILSANPPTEEDSGLNPVPEAEIFGLDSNAGAEVSGVDPETQAEVPGPDALTDVEAPDAEAHQNEDTGNHNSAAPKNLYDPQAEQETEAIEDRYDPEQEDDSEESTAPIVETDHVEETLNHDILGYELDKNIRDDDNDQEDNDGLDPHADDPKQQNEFEQTNTGDDSPELTNEQHPDSGEESGIFDHASYDVPVITKEKDVEGIDAQHLDEIKPHEDNEESCPTAHPDERVVELGLKTEVDEEPNQAVSLVDAVNYEATEDVLDAPYDDWNDTLDGDGDWEAEEDVEEQGHEQEDNYEHEHGHEHEHDTVSNSSSVTLSSKSSFKRSLSEAELEEYVEDDFSPGSPDPKKPRVE